MGIWNKSKKKDKIKSIKRFTKKGGVETAYICPSRRNPKLDYKDNIDRCITEFEDATGFTFIDVEPDGNCFFHALELYYKLSNKRAPDYQELREIVVQFMLDHYAKYSLETGVDIDDILELFNDGVWDNEAGDLVVAAAADALPIQLKVYDLKSGTRKPLTKKRIILHTYPEVGNIPKETAMLLRINQGHYGLLIKENENILSNSMMSLHINNTNRNTKKKNNRNTNRNNQ
jgi:hypothetical protein